MQVQISSGTIDAPSWDMVRCSKLAARMYAPLGTEMALGDYVRLCSAFAEAFKWAERERKGENGGMTDGEEEGESERQSRAERVDSLRRDLKVRPALL